VYFDPVDVLRFAEVFEAKELRIETPIDHHRFQ